MKTAIATLLLLGAAAAQAHPGAQDLAHDQVYWRHAPATAAPGTVSATSAPEMDPSNAIAAFALLLGGLAIVNGSRSTARKAI